MHLFGALTPAAAGELEFLTWSHMALSIDAHLDEMRRLSNERDRRTRPVYRGRR